MDEVLEYNRETLTDVYVAEVNVRTEDVENKVQFLQGQLETSTTLQQEVDKIRNRGHGLKKQVDLLVQEFEAKYTELKQSRVNYVKQIEGEYSAYLTKLKTESEKCEEICRSGTLKDVEECIRTLDELLHHTDLPDIEIVEDYFESAQTTATELRECFGRLCVREVPLPDSLTKSLKEHLSERGDDVSDIESLIDSEQEGAPKPELLEGEDVSKKYEIISKDVAAKKEDDDSVDNLMDSERKPLSDLESVHEEESSEKRLLHSQTSEKSVSEDLPKQKMDDISEKGSVDSKHDTLSQSESIDEEVKSDKSTIRSQSSTKSVSKDLTTQEKRSDMSKEDLQVKQLPSSEEKKTLEIDLKKESVLNELDIKERSQKADTEKADTQHVSPSNEDTEKADTPHVSQSNEDTEKANTPHVSPSNEDTEKADTPHVSPSNEDTEKADTPRLSPSNADTEKANTPPVSPSNEDTEKADTPHVSPSNEDTEKANIPRLSPSNEDTEKADTPHVSPSNEDTEKAYIPRVSPSNEDTEKADTPPVSPSNEEGEEVETTDTSQVLDNDDKIKVTREDVSVPDVADDVISDGSQYSYASSAGDKSFSQGSVEVPKRKVTGKECSSSKDSTDGRKLICSKTPMTQGDTFVSMDVPTLKPKHEFTPNVKKETGYSFPVVPDLQGHPAEETSVLRLHESRQSENSRGLKTEYKKETTARKGIKSSSKEKSAETKTTSGKKSRKSYSQHSDKAISDSTPEPGDSVDIDSEGGDSRGPTDPSHIETPGILEVLHTFKVCSDEIISVCPLSSGECAWIARQKGKHVFRAIKLVNRSGKVKQTSGFPRAVVDISVDKDDGVLVTCTDSVVRHMLAVDKSVMKFETDEDLTSLCQLSSGNVVVCHYLTSKVILLDSDGVFLRCLDGKGQNRNIVGNPWKVRVNANNDDVVIINRQGPSSVVLVDKDLNLKFLFDGGNTFTQDNLPSILSTSGATGEKLASGTTHKTTSGSSYDDRFIPVDACFDDSDNIIIAEYSSKAVVVLDKAGQLLGTLYNECTRPTSLAMDIRGHLWVGYSNGKIDIIRHLKEKINWLK